MPDSSMKMMIRPSLVAFFDAEKRDLPLEVVRHVLRTVIVSHREAVRDVGREAAEVSAHALAYWFQSLEARGSRMGVNADALGGTMIHRDEYCRRPFTGEGGGKVGAPHGVDSVRNDGSVVTAWASR